ncbi:MAG TPA: ACP phosphodiesterase [bacterium]|nr:ACP phosphodiesterase [bacterium]
MNHLAHCFLAEIAGRSIAGSMAGDFFRGVLPPADEPAQEGSAGAAAEDLPAHGSALSPEFIEGIRFHRVVDSFTDDHPVVARSKARLRPPYRRYAGVLIDIHYDHCLARHWLEFATTPLTTFAARVAQEIGMHLDEFPERARPVLQFLLRTNLLVAYREREGIARTLEGMSRRMSHENPLGSAIHELDEHAAQLEADFFEFFPGAIAMAKRVRDNA